jgi:hypothetical protein
LFFLLVVSTIQEICNSSVSSVQGEHVNANPQTKKQAIEEQLQL